jgi:hypothetical protein
MARTRTAAPDEAAKVLAFRTPSPPESERLRNAIRTAEALPYNKATPEEVAAARAELRAAEREVLEAWLGGHFAHPLGALTRLVDRARDVNDAHQHLDTCERWALVMTTPATHNVVDLRKARIERNVARRLKERALARSRKTKAKE